MAASLLLFPYSIVYFTMRQQQNAIIFYLSTFSNKNQLIQSIARLA
jgi:hypothetical protein